MSRKRILLTWGLTFIIVLTGTFWIGCGGSKTEIASESETTTALSESPQRLPREDWTPPEGSFLTKTDGILNMSANIEDETLNDALQEALNEGLITEKQVEDIQLWWAIRPEALSLENFPIRIPEDMTVPPE
jgi:hypothetical protein